MALDPTLWLGKGGHLIDCNAAAERILGARSRAQAVWLTMEMLFPARQPDRQLAAGKAREAAAVVQERGSALL